MCMYIYKGGAFIQPFLVGLNLNSRQLTVVTDNQPLLTNQKQQKKCIKKSSLRLKKNIILNRKKNLNCTYVRSIQCFRG
jgi:hypothetical protein